MLFIRHSPFGLSTMNVNPAEGGFSDRSCSSCVARARHSAVVTAAGSDLRFVGHSDGAMTSVQENMAKLTAEDRDAIAAYLKSLPPKPSRWKK